MRLWRSLLFVPANQKRMLDKVGGLPADGFIFDLEDTVPPAEKANARAMSKETIAKTPGKKSWVRVNSVPSGYLHEDLEAFIGAPGLAGFVVPKQDSVGDVAFVDRLIASIDTLKRPARIKRLLDAPRWDLVVFDEAHHLTAYKAGGKVRKTENYKLAEALKDHGALKVVAYCTHPVLSGRALENISESVLDELVVTNTIPLSLEFKRCKKIRQLSVAEMLAETIRRMAVGESVSSMYVD